MLFYRAALPLSRKTLTFAAGIIRRHRKSIGSRWRKLNPGQQALLVLAYLRKGETFAELAAGFGVGTTTAWRYVEEVITLLAARAPKLRKAARDATRAGWAYVVLDGTLIPIDRVAADRPLYSGKHKRHGMNLQVIASPDGDILWVSGALPGSVHDKKAEWVWGVLAELEAAGLIVLADKGYQGSTYAKLPYRGKNKPESQKQANRAHANCGHLASARTPSSRPGEFSASSAAAPGALASSPRPSTYCRSAKHNQDGKGSVSEHGDRHSPRPAGAPDGAEAVRRVARGGRAAISRQNPSSRGCGAEGLCPGPASSHSGHLRGIGPRTGDLEGP